MILPLLLHPQPLLLSCSFSSEWPSASDDVLLVKAEPPDISAASTQLSLNTKVRCRAQALRISSGACRLRSSDPFLSLPHSMTPSIDTAHSNKRSRKALDSANCRSKVLVSGYNCPKFRVSALTRDGRPGSSGAELEQIDNGDGPKLQLTAKKKASGKMKSAEELHFEAIECYCLGYDNEEIAYDDRNGRVVDFEANAVLSLDTHGGDAVSTPVNESKYLDVSRVSPWISDGASSISQSNGCKEKILPQKKVSFITKELQMPAKMSQSKGSVNVNDIDGPKMAYVDTDNAEVKAVLQGEKSTQEFTREPNGRAHNSDNSQHKEKLVEEEAEQAQNCQSPNKEQKANVESVHKTRNLSEEQKIRMELNKAAALARRHMRSCEDAVADAQVKGLPFPKFESLLVERSWAEALSSEFQKPYMDRLYEFVSQEAAGRIPIYPPPAKLFNAFNSCPLDKVKVVLIGQDPYHGSGQAMGLCFSVERGTKLPSSLTNIFLEVQSDLGCVFPSHGNLEKWAHQGVLLLNTVLTVRDRHANSHAKKGWELFTDAAIRTVVQQRLGIVFLLWGNQAQEKLRLINKTSHHVLKAFHPSGISAHKGFFKCRHFSRTNQVLVDEGSLPIDWQL